MSAPTRDTARSSASREHRRVPRLSSVTAKFVMAATGTVFALFVVAHLLGNLKVYLGAEHYDDYGHWLRTLGEPLLPYSGVLWILRAILALCVLGHVGCGAMLWLRARKARGPFKRRNLGWGIRTFSARTMPVTGIVLGLFIVIHILDLTTGTAPVASSGFDPGTTSTSAAYENLVASLDRPVVASIYLVAMTVLGLHLLHGLWSAVNDFGVTGQRGRKAATIVGGTLAALIFVGNASIPVAVLTGVVS